MACSSTRLICSSTFSCLAMRSDSQSAKLSAQSPPCSRKASPRCARGQALAQIVDLPGHHDRRQARQIGDGALRARRVVVARLLLRLARLPAGRVPGCGIGRSHPQMLTRPAPAPAGQRHFQRRRLSAADSPISQRAAVQRHRVGHHRQSQSVAAGALVGAHATSQHARAIFRGDARAVILDADRSRCAMCRARVAAAPRTRTLPRHHLQALSSRLPSSSVMSPPSPTKPASAATSASMHRSLPECTLSSATRRSATSGATGTRLLPQRHAAAGRRALAADDRQSARCGRSRDRAWRVARRRPRQRLRASRPAAS